MFINLKYCNGWIDFDKFEKFRGISYKTIGFVLFSSETNIYLKYLKFYFRHTILL